MTPKDADGGALELGLPDGGSVLIVLGETVARDPEVECSVLLAVLDAGDTEADVRVALVAYAARAGLRALLSRTVNPTTVVIG